MIVILPSMAAMLQVRLFHGGPLSSLFLKIDSSRFNSQVPIHLRDPWTQQHHGRREQEQTAHEPQFVDVAVIAAFPFHMSPPEKSKTEGAVI